ncbi:hypothetical protein HQ35_10075 [Porphyromonas cangingivalis]|uniref:Biotin synthesis protein BioG n=1 Tax=Porphyromonas cangingivalis TaxID=36874 RepID=A0A0A2EQA4_PORCN|nr:pimeloyl-ACP methyl esterase BioG family protein [Porphyromonas cangingivalis]KGN78549.1 hypothetical protein HQ35_10075 [Porphyromonas cangingivalis]
MNTLLHQYSSDIKAERLLIYFTGWGTTPEVVGHLSVPEGWDYLTCWDYTTLKDGDLPDLSQYRKVIVVAWSMGVWAADKLAHLFPEDTYGVAINGTPLPMHNDYGIPDLIFQGTLDGLNDENRARFDRRMCGGKSLLALYQSFSARSTDDLRDELLSVYEQVKGLDASTPSLAWRKAYVGTKDLIVPPDNQTNYWSRFGTEVRILDDIGHYPFTLFATWDEVL